MNALSKILVVKIAATLSLWCVPLLLFPPRWLSLLGLPPQESYLFVRLLGMAYLAFCVGYGFALKETLQGRMPLGTVWSGIVSNGGACALLLYYGIAGAWSAWGGFMQGVMWFSVPATAALAVAMLAVASGRIAARPHELGAPRRD
jgi:hypothetical protein